MKRLLCIVALMLCFNFISVGQLKPGKAGSFSEYWSIGKITFSSGDTISCKLRFNATVANGLLQARCGESVITLPASEVRHFNFFDSARNAYRSFYSLAFNDGTNKHFFLESLYRDDQYSILLQRTFGVPFDYMTFSRFISKTSAITRSYILNLTTGELLPLSKQHTLRLLGRRKQEINAFIDSKDIRFRRIVDYIEVFQYHSSL